MTGRGTRATWLRAFAVAAVACGVLGSAVSSQEVGIYRSDSTSQLDDLQGATGVGAYVLLFWPGVNVRSSIYSQESSQTRTGRSCAVVRPSANCGDEEITRQTRLRGFSVAAAIPVLSASAVQLELGSGLSFNLLDSQDQVPSGRRTTLFTEQTGQIGVLGSAAARVRPVSGLPVVLYVLAARHQVRFTACGEYDWMDDPFCGATGLNELRAGVGYMLRR